MKKSQKAQKDLQQRAREISREYPWDRFKDLMHRLGEISFQHDLCFFQELEGNYRNFVRFLLRPQNRGWAPMVSSGHLNFLRDLAWAKEGHPFGATAVELDGAKQFFYQHLGTETLDVLVRLLQTEDEALILLPRYWSEEFGNAESLRRKYVEQCQKREREQLREEGFLDIWIEGHLRKFPPINADRSNIVIGSRIEELIEDIGRQRLKARIREKIHPFPPEVHGLRTQVLEDTVVVLNQLYVVSGEYLQERA